MTTNCFRQVNIFVFLAFMFPVLFRPSACSISFNISRFDYNTSDVVYEGDGKASDGYVDLTDADAGQYFRVGRIVYSKPVRLRDSNTKQLADFTSHFSFTVDTLNRDNFSDGFAFFIAPVDYPFPPNSAGGYLGLLNSTIGFSSENQIIMVEFDTWKNTEFEPSEPDNHVGININRITSAVSADWDARSASLKLCNCWITYNSTTMSLNVFWTYEENPVYNGSSILSQTVHLTLLPELVTVGFSAATGLYGERHMINSWEFSSNWGSTYGKNHKQPMRPRKFTVYIIVVSVICFSLLLAGAALGTIIVKKRNSKKAARKEACADSGINDYIEKGVLPRIFSYQYLVNATNGFADDRRLGQGGSGHVYKGALSDLGCLVAVKKIFSDSGHSEKFFINEVKIISRLIHQNLLQLIGCCHEKGEFILVHEYMPNGSLDRHLFGDKRTLPWDTRYKIALGLASALHYLHKEAGKCVIHGDIKSANVLLDKDFKTKLGGFRVARHVDSQLRTQATAVDPEYLYEGRMSKDSDVFSFGVVVLEIACGRKTYLEGECPVPLATWVWELYVAGNILGAADERLKMVFCEKEMECLLLVGWWCTHPNDERRPKIGEVIKVLKFEVPLPVLLEDVHDQDHFVPPLPRLRGRSRTSLASSSARSMSRNGAQGRTV
ncbi:hypothetical protein BT93_L1648 [Corymbia citriodora subsp. variegata]|uniref:Protein kinase domain-containing protein n=1 Tax=Corymbia citriodora subsp. variegata TaxID=360336 RepID=A0A8T0D005_CORYI|nr:hypothetical protein BT93_L1648 [Corymbia citriodora subsp. variegata]